MFGYSLPSSRRALSLALMAALILIHGCAEDMVAPTVALPDPPPDPTGAWLDANTHPFSGPHLSLPHTEIEFLRDLVGDARIVALGEATHGTRDFFEMKARILRFLVEEMGFNTFAIEATWPESRRIDHYVRTGEGDSHELLTGLYFWTWRTESVLEMIEWMRDHNEAGGDIGFHGFDMQFPGMALHNVREYVGKVDPDALHQVSTQLECLQSFANDVRGRRERWDYENQPASYHTECAASLEEAREFLLANRETYEATAGKDAFEVTLQSLRVALQFHLHEVGEQDRDESMAENTVWLSDRIGPEGRMVLWAHNYHVSTQPGAQGSFLRETFGDDMVVVAFSHERGRLTARRLRPEGGCAELIEHDLSAPIEGSYEQRMSLASAPRFVLDLRNRNTAEPGGSWLRGRRPFRSFGACYDAERPDIWWRDTPLTEWYDVMIHFESTGPTTILPCIFPDSW